MVRWQQNKSLIEITTIAVFMNMMVSIRKIQEQISFFMGYVFYDIDGIDEESEMWKALVICIMYGC